MEPEDKYPYNCFGFSHLSSLYPSGVLGLKDRGTRVFETLQRGFEKVKKEDLFIRSIKTKPGHNIGPQLSARLGDEQTMEILRWFVEKYQIYKNATCHFEDVDAGNRLTEKFKVRKIKGTETTDWREVHDKSAGERVELDPKQFLHLYFEAHANMQAGIQEMLCQSHDGIIRVFPAVEQEFARKCLEEEDWTIEQIALETGYSNTNAFRKAYKRYFGVTPMQDRKRNNWVR